MVQFSTPDTGTIDTQTIPSKREREIEGERYSEREKGTEKEI